MFLEINYTFRHSDEDFMGKIQAPELPMLIGPGLISVSFNLSAPESAEDDPDDPTNVEGEGAKEGIMAFNKSLAEPLVSALTDEKSAPKGLRALNTTLYTLTAEMLQQVLGVQKNTMVLQVTAEVEPGEDYKKKLLKALEPCKELEQVEIIANPSLQFFMEVQNPREFEPFSYSYLTHTPQRIPITTADDIHFEAMLTIRRRIRRHGQDFSICRRLGHPLEEVREALGLQGECAAHHQYG